MKWKHILLIFFIHISVIFNRWACTSKNIKLIQNKFKTKYLVCRIKAYPSSNKKLYLYLIVYWYQCQSMFESDIMIKNYYAIKGCHAEIYES